MLAITGKDLVDNHLLKSADYFFRMWQKSNRRKPTCAERADPAVGAAYTGSFELWQFGLDGPLVSQEFAFTTPPVPEPETLWLLGSGAFALACRRRRK